MKQVATQKSNGKSKATWPPAVNSKAADPAPEAPRSSLDEHHRDNLCHDNEGEASAFALIVAALAPTSSGVDPAAFGREALRGISDDLMLYSMADETDDGPVESIMQSALYRIRRRADAAAEVIRRLQARGNLEPDPVQL